jgi:hypothetical protein
VSKNVWKRRFISACSEESSRDESQRTRAMFDLHGAKRVIGWLEV